MIEKVGKVTLDLSLYSGKDYYSDGDVEDKILEIVKNHDESEYNSLILSENDWAVLYHLSEIRSNILSWLPINKNERVLEIGSGCGAVTGALADLAKEVTCVELSLRRNLINAHRNKQRDNIILKVGNFQDIYQTLDDTFDYVTLIGVLEYSKAYINNSDTPFFEMLKMAKKKLSPNGKLVIAIENKFGLKYWAGCKEDHSGHYFTGIEGYDNRSTGAQTFSKNELEKLFESVGFSDYKFYYPYPDYKMPMSIYSDEFLPKVGELSNNNRNFDNLRLSLFNEAKAFDEIIKDGMFPYFSNSFLTVVSN